MSGSEYRVRWQREGRKATGVIYQCEPNARAKIDRLLALEELKGDSRRFEDMPDLVGTPTLEVREVGEWGPHPDAPSSAATEDARASMRVWTDVDEYDGAGAF